MKDGNALQSIVKAAAKQPLGEGHEGLAGRRDGIDRWRGQRQFAQARVEAASRAVQAARENYNRKTEAMKTTQGAYSKSAISRMRCVGALGSSASMQRCNKISMILPAECLCGGAEVSARLRLMQTRAGPTNRERKKGKAHGAR
jgi:hypothetical protein